jgi:hypothetical protein
VAAVFIGTGGLGNNLGNYLSIFVNFRRFTAITQSLGKKVRLWRMLFEKAGYAAASTFPEIFSRGRCAVGRRLNACA